MSNPRLQCPLHRILSLPASQWSHAKLKELEKIFYGTSCPSHNHPPLRELVLKAPNEGSTPLLIAVHLGDVEWVKRIVEIWGADVGAAGSINLHDICVRRTRKNGQPASVSPSIYLNLQLDQVTPLFIAALNKNSQIVRYLVGKGADVSVGILPTETVDRLAGLSPLHAAFCSEDDFSLQSTEQQLDIIRFLVDSGANPSALSSNGTPIWAMGSKYFNQHGKLDDDYTAGWCKPAATTLLIELGMSVSQPCLVPLGRNLLHHLLVNKAPDSKQDGGEQDELFDLVLGKNEADLQVRDKEGVTSLMAAAMNCSDKGPQMQVLKNLLGRNNIPRIDKINALELAAAVLLVSYKMNPHHFDDMCDFLAEAQNLRRLENCPLTINASSSAIEWITTASNHQEIEQRITSERILQSILIRLRIFSAASGKAVYRYVCPLMKRIYQDSYPGYPVRHVIDVYLALLKTISKFDPQGEDATGILLTNESIIPHLVNLLKSSAEQLPLFYLESLKTSLDLVSTIHRQIHLSGRKFVVKQTYLSSLVALTSMVSKVPDMWCKETKDLLDPIVNSQLRDQDENTLLLGACIWSQSSYSYHHSSITDLLRLLLDSGADPNAVNCKGNGALHILVYCWYCPELDATAHLLLEHGIHLDIVNEDGETVNDVWRKKMAKRKSKRQRRDIPDWMKEGVSKLTCMSARIIRRHQLPNADKLPKSLQAFVRIH